MQKRYSLKFICTFSTAGLIIGFVTGIFAQQHILFGNYLQSLGVRSLLIEVGFISPWESGTNSTLFERNNELEIVDSQIRRPYTECASLDKSTLMVMVALGQSNAANHAPNGTASKHNVYNYYKGKCYHAMDPLLGAGGIYGSVWTKFADLIIEDGVYDNVVIVSLAEGGSSVADWIPGGKYNNKIVNNLRGLEKQSLGITHIFWHQGETDGRNKTSKPIYKKRLRQVIKTFRQNHIDAPFYVAIATRCPDINADIQEAQAEITDRELNIFQGPNTDAFHWIYRMQDQCHFNALGVKKHASMWFDIVKVHKETLPTGI